MNPRAQAFSRNVNFLAVLACALLASLHASWAQSRSDQANFAFLDTQPLTLTSKGDSVLLAQIPVRNVGGATGRAAFCVFLTGSGCVPATNAGTANPEMGPGDVAMLPFQISTAEPLASGYLGLQTFDKSGHLVDSSYRRFVVQAPIFPASVWDVAYTSVGSAILLCLTVWVCLRMIPPQPVRLWAVMGSTSGWDFSKSWASNITLAGAFLSSALAFAFLPEQTQHMNRAGYAILNLLFTIVAAIAPFVFNIFRWPAPNKTDYQGHVFWFLIAGGITVFAVIAQLIVLKMVIDEFRVGGMISLCPARVFKAVVYALAWCVMFYSGRSLYFTAKTQSIPPPAPQNLQAPQAQAQAAVPLQQWSSL